MNIFEVKFENTIRKTNNRILAIVAAAIFVLGVITPMVTASTHAAFAGDHHKHHKDCDKCDKCDCDCKSDCD
jgi:hypothetical protein